MTRTLWRWILCNTRLHAAQEGVWVIEMRLEMERATKGKAEAEKIELELRIELLKKQLHAYFMQHTISCSPRRCLGYRDEVGNGKGCQRER